MSKVEAISEELLFESTEEFSRLMMKYRCAIREVRTKLEVLNEDFSQTVKRNPIENISSRVKSPESIIGKLKRKNYEISIEEIVDNIHDVAGIRVICSFIEDIYAVADMLLKQDDIRLIERKDYIKNPKPNGYRSLHLIVEIPIFLAESKEYMQVEVQIRTIAMDFWASLEHKLRYKKDIDDSGEIGLELKKCADESAMLDIRMQNINKLIEGGGEMKYVKEDSQ